MQGGVTWKSINEIINGTGASYLSKSWCLIFSFPPIHLSAVTPNCAHKRVYLPAINIILRPLWVYPMFTCYAQRATAKSFIQSWVTLCHIIKSCRIHASMVLHYVTVHSKTTPSPFILLFKKKEPFLCFHEHGHCAGQPSWPLYQAPDERRRKGLSNDPPTKYYFKTVLCRWMDVWCS